MVFRLATLADVPAIVLMGLRFIQETSYRDQIAQNPAAMAAIVTRLVDTDIGDVCVVEKDGALVGMLGMFVWQHPISDERIASEMFWWVEPEHRGGRAGMQMLRWAEDWAAAQHAQRVLMIAPTDAVAHVYERRRYTKVETTYTRAL